MFVVHVTFCLVVSILLTLVVVEAEIDASRGHLLANAEIAAGRTSVWSPSALSPPRTYLR